MKVEKKIFAKIIGTYQSFKMAPTLSKIIKKLDLICKKQHSVAILKITIPLAANWVFLCWLKCHLTPMSLIGPKRYYLVSFWSFRIYLSFWQRFVQYMHFWLILNNFTKGIFAALAILRKSWPRFGTQFSLSSKQLLTKIRFWLSRKFMRPLP